MSSSLISPVAVPQPAYTYAEFRALVATLAAERRTTGPEQTPGLIRYTDQNQAHLDRAHAVPLLPELVEKLANLPRPEQWLVLAEAWCGDTAHTLPILAHLAEVSAGRVTLHVLLRSDHPALMAAHQTNGGNSIPKLVRRDAATGTDLGDWGPRPAAAQELAHRLHADKSLHVNQIIKEMNAWYEADNGAALQHELLAALG
ncbi:thioredoxin family protein [Hymenobacter properus]|uniref:Thioredoxin family protein n=1 Tax=Hymenobacter properus TaxID=2791026 RepID=A0A931BIP2_9BACT|nr:thioredoxin family protein [Hymenobacter properus]MBF9143226.1 thioredoxin family protein [Hymenobacter properus]MBR7722035.1 thioredoxin family protein [Microvirga sp. SRT04]